jgi:hypothetical protein
LKIGFSNIKFDLYFEVSVVQYKNPIAIDDTVQSVGDCDNGAVRKLTSDSLLDEIVRPNNLL